MTTPASSLPAKIGRYQILERVGRGGMGVLYRGHDPVLDREVAVKVMLADFSDDTEQMRPRFYREAKAAAKLQHRNIVTVFEFAEENNQPHIVMEFLRGTPLNVRMEEKPPLTLDDKLDIVAQLCAGLGYAHSQGVVHRDVKPANVFLLQDGAVKLLDFGIAKLSTSTLTRQGDVLGSAPYMSPEQVSGTQDLDGRSDVWSTGVLLYELLTGRKPFDGDALTTVIVGILKEEPPPVEKYVPGLPQPVIDVLARALCKDREKRFQTAEELGRELQLIRKTMNLSTLPPMEATRFASTNVLKALHEDRQKEDLGSARDKTLQGAPRLPEPVEAPGSKTWVIGAVAAAALLVAIVGYVMTRPSQPAAGPVATSEVRPNPEPVSAPPSQSAPPAASPSVSQAATIAAADPTTTRKTATPPPVKKTVTTPVVGEPPPAPAPRAGNVVAVLSAAYPFEVRDGGRVISAASTNHELAAQSNGRTLRLVAPDVMLDHPVRVDGNADNHFEYSPPGLGQINIRAARGDCKAMINKRDIGYGPWTKPVVVAAGDYRVELVCPDGVNPFQQITVTQGRTAEVRIQQK